MRLFKILMIRQGYFPDDPRVRKEAFALRQAGWDVHILCIGRTHEKKRENIKGINIYRLHLPHMRKGILRYLWEYGRFYFFALVNSLKLHFRFKLDIIQVNTMPDFLIFAVLPARMLGVKLVLDVHEPMAELWKTLFPNNKFTNCICNFIKFVSRLSFRVSDKLITVTEEMRELIKKRGGYKKEILVIHNLPDPKEFYLPSSSSFLHKDKDKFILVTHGSVEERYGIDTVLEALALLKKRGIGGKLEYWIIGDGSYLLYLKEKARDLGIQNQVKFWGFLPFNKMVELLNEADVGIVAMKKNPYSDLIHTNKVYEFVHLKKPVIISHRKAISEIFSSSDVMYFEAGNPFSLAEVISQVVDNENLRAKLVQNALKKIENIKWEIEKEKYIQFLSSLF